MLPGRVAEHGCFELVIEAQSAHPATLRLVLFGKLPASGSAAVQMASNETCPRVTRETPRPAPRLVRWLVREMHGSRPVLVRAIRGLATILRLQGGMRSSQRLASALRVPNSLVRVWLWRRQWRERALTARALRLQPAPRLHSQIVLLEPAVRSRRRASRVSTEIPRGRARRRPRRD